MIKNKGLTHIGMIWKAGDSFLTQGSYRDVPQPVYNQLPRDASKFFANRTKGKKAYLVMPHSEHARKDSIFWSVELDELINGNQVDTIIWLDKDK